MKKLLLSIAILITMACLHRLHGQVTVSGRKILVNGSEYFIKGIAYNPVPIGSTQRNFNNLAQDIALMKEASINTIRVYSPIDDEAVLTTLNNNGIKVIVGFGWNMGGWYDIQSGSFINYINKYKNHPAILLWELGNEYNYHPEWFGGNIGNWYTSLNNAAARAKSADASHPVATAHGELPNAQARTSCPNIDVWGMNVYRWDNPASIFSDWAAVSGKPMYLSEAGADNWMTIAQHGYASGYNERVQADALNRIIDNTAANRNLNCGIVVFEFCDEWWKAGNNSVQNTGGWAPNSSAVPYDGTPNEEYWGIVDIYRNRRQGFHAVKNKFAGIPTNPVQNNPLPAPWVTRDIGTVGVAGSASHTNGTFTVQGSGADIWNSADGFRYVYQQVSGDREIIARVAGIQNTDPWAKAGLMIREDLTAGARHASVFVTPSNGVSLQSRSTTGGSSVSNTVAGIAAPRWLRLERRGNTFTAFHSADGNAWSQIGSLTISMSQTVYVGLAVTSHNNSVINTSSFTNVSTRSLTASPTIYALRSVANSRFVSVAADRLLRPTATSIGTNERFELVRHADGTVSLRHIGYNAFVCSDLNRVDAELIANRTTVAGWEKFDLINNADGTISLRASHGSYVVAENGGGSTLQADRNAIGGWEKFQLVETTATAMRQVSNLDKIEEEGNGVKVFPTMADNLVNIISSNEIDNISIANLEGIEFYSGKGFSENAVIDISAFPQGVYLVNFNSGGALYTKKILKY
ncbi:MAG: glycoside hydrolase family 2 TIM barrel-domain containing protein [Cytophagaceae bacterium]